MQRYILIILFTGLLAYGAVQASSSYNNNATPEHTDEILRHAVLTDFDGNEFTLEDYAGKTLLLDFWETWCTPCIRSMPTLQKLMDDYPDDFLVLAISPGFMDTPEQVRNFVDNNDYDFVFLFGEQLFQDLEIQSLPHKVYISPDGDYVLSISGSQGPEEDYQKSKEIIESFQ
ncbi:TlpA disulfide reductase family protein [Balneolaceae bacterium ANBcel3]|nr:TlpA disulfide reductase family protein [Balneolaceae bacterium ANBcel3]